MNNLIKDLCLTSRRVLTLYPSLNIPIIIFVSILCIDNILSYFISSSINDLFEPCDATLMIIEFMIGLLNIVSFTSWYIQLDLILPNGVCPAHETINQWKFRFNITENTSLFNKFFKIKRSFFWISHTETFIRRIGIIGIISGFIICLLPFYSYSIFILSICYLFNAILYSSYIDISGDFLMLQNDSEMVELNLIMFFCSFIRFRYPFIVIFVYRWLSFRIMIGCGMCKYFGSPMWKELTAMIKHYITQPLPNIFAYYYHNLPTHQHKLSVIITFIIEGPLTFFVFCSSTFRYIGFIGFQVLILMINSSGNFGNIGQLMMTETMSLLDDNILPQILINISNNMKTEYLNQSTHWFYYEWITIPCSCIIIFAYVIASWYQLTLTSQYPLPVSNDIIRLSKLFRRNRFGNKYAKFGSMNTERYEFIIEGSNDMNEWKTYDFLYKPSKVTDKPPFVMLHLPRLDWRIWFLPLYWQRFLSYNYNYYQPPQWFIKVMELLKENNPSILRLIKYNPFPIHGPTQIRCVIKKFDFITNDNDNDNANPLVWYSELLMTNRLVTM